MFDERWLNLLVIAGIVGAIMRSPALIGLVMMSGTLVLISHQLRGLALRGVDYKRRFNETRLFLGETVTISCTASNHGRLPLISLTIYDGAPRGFRKTTDDSTITFRSGGRLSFTILTALLPGEHAGRRVILQPTRRGYYVFGEVELRAADLLGMFEVDGIVEMHDTLIVYPRIFKLAERGIEMIAPHRSNRVKPKTQDGRKLRRFKRRWKIERLNAWLQNNRRVAVRYERKVENYIGFVHLACVKILLRNGF